MVIILRNIAPKRLSSKILYLLTQIVPNANFLGYGWCGGLEPMALGVIVDLKPLLEDSINPMLPHDSGEAVTE